MNTIKPKHVTVSPGYLDSPLCFVFWHEVDQFNCYGRRICGDNYSGAESPMALTELCNNNAPGVDFILVKCGYISDTDDNEKAFAALHEIENLLERYDIVGYEKGRAIERIKSGMSEYANNNLSDDVACIFSVECGLENLGRNFGALSVDVYREIMNFCTMGE